MESVTSPVDRLREQVAQAGGAMKLTREALRAVFASGGHALTDEEIELELTMGGLGYAPTLAEAGEGGFVSLWAKPQDAGPPPDVPADGEGRPGGVSIGRDLTYVAREGRLGPVVGRVGLLRYGS